MESGSFGAFLWNSTLVRGSSCYIPYPRTRSIGLVTLKAECQLRYLRIPCSWVRWLMEATTYTQGCMYMLRPCSTSYSAVPSAGPPSRVMRHSWLCFPTNPVRLCTIGGYRRPRAHSSFRRDQSRRRRCTERHTPRVSESRTQ